MTCLPSIASLSSHKKTHKIQQVENNELLFLGGIFFAIQNARHQDPDGWHAVHGLKTVLRMGYLPVLGVRV